MSVLSQFGLMLTDFARAAVVFHKLQLPLFGLHDFLHILALGANYENRLEHLALCLFVVILAGLRRHAVGQETGCER